MNNRNQHSRSWTHSIVLGQNPNNDNVSLKVDDDHNLKTNDTLSRKIIHTGKILLTSPSGVGCYSDTLPVPVSDADNRAGWSHTKVGGVEKLNYYFYTEGNIPLKLKDLRCLKSIVSIDNYQSNLSNPFYVVYTKMTGSGDAGSWYHSKRNYSLTALERIVVGERIQMYSINKGENLQGQRQVEFNTISDTGDCDDEEEILTMSIHTDSTSPVSSKILVKSLGYETTQGIIVNFELNA